MIRYPITVRVEDGLPGGSHHCSTVHYLSAVLFNTLVSSEVEELIEELNKRLSSAKTKA